ncbi:putative membrane protein [Propionispora sp. 2/2-37]|uniref:cytosine permease n=1 Tax=Propionispora sp. 2/2-37 TaxID=1677858 RepID=UPI0006BB90F2|nr:cytosine permease [Propionispora sp. 2/2-37]CUH95384.1 putative membrane protein [Propionispora sp. 2/2-37]
MSEVNTSFSTPPAKEYSAVEPVAMQDRNMDSWDMFATWIGANANNGTWYVGGVIAATCFIPSLYVTALANPIAYIIMALVGFIGFKVGVSTMALTRFTFGIKGSFLPSLLNTTQFIGWTAVNTYIAAISVSFVLKELFGWPALGEPGGNSTMLAGIVIMSVLHLISIAAGHNSVKLVERIGVGLVLLLAVWETVVVFQQVSLSQILAWKPPADKVLPFGSAMDIMAAFSLGWVPAIAEFTRYCKTKTSATWIPMIGANIGLFWFTLIGSVVTIGVAISTGNYDPNNSDPSGIVSKLGLGIVAFLVIIITSTTANAINLMAAGISLTNMTAKVKALPALWAVTLIAAIVTTIPLFIGSFLHSFILFLDYIGMVFGPVFAIVIVNYYLVNARQYTVSDVDQKDGRYWFTGGFNWRAILVWLIGVVSFLFLREVSICVETIGATYPAMLLTGVIYYFAAKSRNE